MLVWGTIVLMLIAITGFSLRRRSRMVDLLTPESGTPMVIHQEVGGYYRFCGYRSRFLDDVVLQAYKRYLPHRDGLSVLVDFHIDILGTQRWTQIRILKPFQATYPIKIVRG